MQKNVVWISLFFLFIFSSSTCRAPKTCPPEPYHYKLHQITEKGFKHIFTIEEDCQGCHHIVAEKCGLVKITNKKKGKYGIFRADVEKIKGNPCKKLIGSTFFPEHWSVETTLNKIEEARQNIQETLNEREKIGKTKENIKIKLIFDKHQPSKIFNAFPIMEENEKKYYFNVY